MWQVTASPASRRREQRFIRDGVYLSALASPEPDYLVTAIASSLNLSLAGKRNLREQLINYLKTKDLLLILDNFENLREGTDLIADILAETSSVRLLITSRERLDLSEEVVLELIGLRYPEIDETSALESYSAVQLFIHSARRSRSVVLT